MAVSGASLWMCDQVNIKSILNHFEELVDLKGTKRYPIHTLLAVLCLLQTQILSQTPDPVCLHTVLSVPWFALFWLRSQMLFLEYVAGMFTVWGAHLQVLLLLVRLLLFTHLFSPFFSPWYFSNFLCSFFLTFLLFRFGWWSTILLVSVMCGQGWSTHIWVKGVSLLLLCISFSSLSLPVATGLGLLENPGKDKDTVYGLSEASREGKMDTPYPSMISIHKI